MKYNQYQWEKIPPQPVACNLLVNNIDKMSLCPLKKITSLTKEAPMFATDFTNHLTVFDVTHNYVARDTRCALMHACHCSGC